MNIDTENPDEQHPAQNPDKVIQLGGFPVLGTTMHELNARLSRVLQANEKQIVFFANTNFIVQCQSLKSEMTYANTLIVNDGIGVDIAAWLVHRTRFPENIPGTDFIPYFLQQNRKHLRIFLFGGKPGVAQRAARILEHEEAVSVVGYCDGYAQARDANEVVAAINKTKANVLLVAMGNPMQEQWILKHYAELQVPVMMGVGALFDFWAGDKPRAPALVRRLHLEWLYRLCLEPARLIRRYTLDIAVFLVLCLRSGKNNLTSHQENAP